MSMVSNLLDSKGHDVLTVQPEQPVQEAIVRMEEISAGTAVVVQDGKVIGILSERDVFRKVVLKQQEISSVLVRDIMTSDPITVALDSALDECMHLMTDKRIRHLPVLKDQELVGIVSIGDVVKYLIVEKDFKIKNLETYISGSMA